MYLDFQDHLYKEEPAKYPNALEKLIRKSDGTVLNIFEYDKMVQKNSAFALLSCASIENTYV